MRRVLMVLSTVSVVASFFVGFGGVLPEASAATFGKTNVGASSDTMLADRKRVNRYSLPVEGEVSKLSIYLAPTSTLGEQKLKGVIYSDESGPKTLLGTSKELIFHHSDTAGWYDLTFTTPVKLSSGNYWLGAITGATSNVAGFRWDSVTNSRDKNVNEYTKGPSNPFGTAEVDSEQMSLYATYSPETWEGFSATNPMPAGRTPGNSESPFNEEVGASPKETANSAAEVEWLLGPKDTSEEYKGPIPKTIERPKQEDIPLVYASNKDPVVELVASGSGNVNKRKIRLPEAAHVGGNSDKHLTIVLAPSDAKAPGELIDLWQANSEGAGGKVKLEGTPPKLSYTNGSTGSMTGKLIEEEPGAVAAGWDAIAGEIRGPELKANTVPHALAAVVWDTKASTFVWPANHNDGKNSEAASPPTGRRFYLVYTDKEIEEIEVGGKHLLPWKQAVLKAIAHYGFYLEDTGNNALNFRWEGENSYVPFGAEEPFTKLAEEQTVEKSGTHYIFNQSEGVKWKERLHAIEPPAH
jgi:hypothetical protein